MGKFIIGIGGTLRTPSSTECAIRSVLDRCEARGARTELFAGGRLGLPFYMPGAAGGGAAVEELVAAMRAADGVVLGSPGYHGGVAGIVKNAIDYAEDLAKDDRVYFADLPIGCIATGFGWQGCNVTLQALRNITHSLRGWPTPLGIAMNSATPAFDANGLCTDPRFAAQFDTMADQLLSFVAPSVAPPE